MIPGYVVWVLWAPVAAYVGYRHRLTRAGLARTAGILFLVTYAFWIASVAFFPLPFSGSHGAPLHVNLIPLQGLRASFAGLTARQIVREHVGNLLLLAPITFVCAALWPRLRAWKWAFVLGVGWSAAIEITQLILSLIFGGYRSVDVNDVMFNLVGALLGYGLFALSRRRLIRSSNRRAEV